MTIPEDTPRAVEIQPPAALFLETTAQILRLQGSPEFQKEIQGLVDSAPKVATSAHVKREFDYLYEELFYLIEQVLDDFPLHGPQLFDDLWHEVQVTFPKHYPLGPQIVADLTKKLSDFYDGERVEPIELKNVCRAVRRDLELGFLNGDLHEEMADKSTCNVWKNRGICSSCHPEPGEECKLRETCVTNRANLLASAETISKTRFKEAAWLSENLPRLRQAEGIQLQELLGKHPDPTGDLVIFWEVPDGWTILSRDRAFQTLAKIHRPEVAFYMVRRRRFTSGRKCKVRYATSAADVDGELVNYNYRGVQLKAPTIIAKKNQPVAFTAEEFPSERTGIVANVDKESPSTFGVRFVTRRRKT